MGNPLLTFWAQLFGHPEHSRRVLPTAQIQAWGQASSTIFLVLRRLRTPLISLIVIFSISVVGLSLIPGVDPEGRTARISLFESFYFMSYTATTIGFGELPWPFTAAQRMWVTISIYLSVIGWAYAIGSMLSLLQDRSFRQAVAFRRFEGKVARLREPFLLIAGFGRAGELLATSFDRLGQQIVVLDSSSDRIEALDLGSYHADIPGLAADAGNPIHLRAAGLGHPHLAGVLALTNDDETNLAVTMAAALIRPDVPIITRTISATIAERIRAFPTPAVVNPFDRFGEHLRLALNAPASYQLLVWLEAGPGALLPERGDPPTHGRWVMCGYGRFGREVTADLRAAGIEVTIIDPVGDSRRGVIVGDASDPDVLMKADLENAVGLVAGTDNDTTNLSMLATARRFNPELFLAARQNRPNSAALFEAMKLDAVLVPSEVVAHEVYAQISTPLLWRFIQDMPARGDAWAADLIAQLRQDCGRSLPALWKISLNREQAPALTTAVSVGSVTLGDVMRSPEDRSRPLRIVPLLLRRGENATLRPDADTVLEPDDQLLFAGESSQRRELESTMIVDSTAAYVLFDRHIPASWVWRKLAGRSDADDHHGT